MFECLAERTIALAQEARRARVRLELPILVDNGNSVPLKVSVDSPMTPNDYVRQLTLLVFLSTKPISPWPMPPC